MLMALTVYSVIVNCGIAAVVLRATFVETGSSLIELNCYSLEMVLGFIKTKMLKELTFVVATWLPHQLVYIAVTFHTTLLTPP